MYCRLPAQQVNLHRLPIIQSFQYCFLCNWSSFYNAKFFAHCYNYLYNERKSSTTFPVAYPTTTHPTRHESITNNQSTKYFKKNRLLSLYHLFSPPKCPVLQTGATTPPQQPGRWYVTKQEPKARDTVGENFHARHFFAYSLARMYLEYEICHQSRSQEYIPYLLDLFAHISFCRAD